MSPDPTATQAFSVCKCIGVHALWGKPLTHGSRRQWINSSPFPPLGLTVLKHIGYGIIGRQSCEKLVSLDTER